MERKTLDTYSKLCTEFYDLEHHVNHEQALAFYMQHAQQTGGPILEPMCGSGRFLIPILQAGLDAEGFDASPYMVDSFKQKLARFGHQKAPVWQQFVSDFESDKRYGLIFIPYGSWGLIVDREESKKSLHVLYRHLQPGGKLIIEIETVASAPQSCGVLRRGIHARADGSKIALSFVVSYQEQTQIFQSNSCYELIVNNTVQECEQESFEQYLYQSDEFDPLLHDTGFIHIKKYPAFDQSQKVTTDTPTIIYECIKSP